MMHARRFPRFGTIYIDPPWAYRNRRTGGSMNSGSSQKYPTLTVRALVELPIPKLAAPDAALWMWATCPMLPEAFHVLNAWGFQYKSQFQWRKTGRLGMGFWNRQDMELLLIAVRGRVPPFRLQRRSCLDLPRSTHSRKPSEFRTIIEQSPSPLPRIELFATEHHPGWTAWGYELGSDVQSLLATGGSNG